MSPPGLKDFALVGLSHKSAPVEVREKLSVTADEMPRFLAELRAADGVEELLLISTCNRVETYAWGASDLFEGVRGVFSQRAGPAVLGSLYDRRGRDAVSHLFRVSSSLDSMVLGEPQILGQVKEAFAAAQQAGTLGGVITGACQAAFSAAKRVRSETAIGAAPVSMASAAVELSRKIFGSLTGRTVLLVGAGEMSELTARHLAEGRPRIVVTNRTFERAVELARLVRGVARPFEELQALLVDADIVVSSTAAPRPILRTSMVHQVLKQRHFRPLLLIDLAVPRDIEEGVDKLENVYAYNVDDLQGVVVSGRQTRETEAEKAELIVGEEVERFLRSRQLRDAVPVLAQLRTRAEELARSEAERTLSNFGEELTPKQRKSIEAMGRAIVNKLLHGTTVRLREAGKAGPDEAAALALLVARLFDLEEPPPGAGRANGVEEPAAGPGPEAEREKSEAAGKARREPAEHP
jgi:glutamyl-tRNA reductase